MRKVHDIRVRRRSLRLPGYDYSQPGAYFLTICVRGRTPVFGDIVNGEMIFNEYGKIVLQCWNKLPEHYPYVVLDAFAVMPNHVHAILLIIGPDLQYVGAGLKPAPTNTKPLSEIVRGFKTFSSRSINLVRGTPGQPLWQRGYYEHIVRDEESLHRIRDYIATNPLRWHLDRENSQALGKDEFDVWLASLGKNR